MMLTSLDAHVLVTAGQMEEALRAEYGSAAIHVVRIAGESANKLQVSVLG